MQHWNTGILLEILFARVAIKIALPFSNVCKRIPRCYSASDKDVSHSDKSMSLPIRPMATINKAINRMTIPFKATLPTHPSHRLTNLFTIV